MTDYNISVDKDLLPELLSSSVRSLKLMKNRSLIF
jgi:hypothetical protein